MANKIVFDDGKEVALSKGTTERLRKELLKPEQLILDVRNIRVSERKISGYYPIAIGIESLNLLPEENNGMTFKYTLALFTKKEAQEIISNLQKVIDNVD